jgi:hypothetical protein
MNKDKTAMNKTEAARKSNNRRRENGNLLVLSSVSFTVAAVATIMGYSFASLFLVNNRLQSSADEIALAGAKKLNEKDRIGQMNNMVVRCRQLVYSSRKDLDDTKKFFPNLEGYAQPLLDEARDSSMTLELERQKIARLAKSEATQAMQNRFNDIKPTYPMVLPWLKIGTPRLTTMTFGRIDDVDSNVEQMKAFKELDDSDENLGYISNMNGRGLKLFKSDLPDGLRLQTVDSDLSFKLSSLPAPVDGIIAPARVMLPAKRKNVSADNAPSVAQVKLQLQVETGLGFKAGASMHSVGVASTTGASVQE